MFPRPPEQDTSNMAGLSSNGAEYKSGSVPSGLIADRSDQDLAGQSRCQLGRNIAKLVKDGDVTMIDIQNGLQEIEERERAAQEILIQTVESLPADKAQRILLEIFEKNSLVRDWLGERSGLKTVSENTLKHEKSIDYIKKIHLSALRKTIKVLVINNGFIEESLQKKLLVEQKDGAFTIRDFGQNSVDAITSDGCEQALASALPN